jgi:tetratricopeptide (TPR) repeat protein
MESYTTRDVARLLRLSEAQVRSQARAGFLTPDRGPRNSYRFSFQDLLILRTARELAGARVPPRRIKRALSKLAHHLPLGKFLTELRITADARRVIVRDGEAAWNPESEQLQIDFAGLGPSIQSRGVALSISQLPKRSAERLSAAQWFDRGEELEDTAPDEAMKAYAHAIALDPGLAGARVNLGRLHQLAGRVAEAINHYREALREGGDATAAFNLGTALEELGRRDSAMAAYCQAIQMDRAFADAHFNLSRLYELVGQRDLALGHLREYQRLCR